MALKKAEAGNTRYFPLNENGTGHTIKGYFLGIRPSKSKDYPDSKNVFLRLSEDQELVVTSKEDGDQLVTLPKGTRVGFGLQGQFRWLLEEYNITPGMYVEVTYLGVDMTKKIRGKNPHQFELAYDDELVVDVPQFSGAAEDEETDGEEESQEARPAQKLTKIEKKTETLSKPASLAKTTLAKNTTAAAKPAAKSGMSSDAKAKLEAEMARIKAQLEGGSEAEAAE